MRRWSCHRREGFWVDKTRPLLPWKCVCFSVSLTFGFGASFGVAGAWFVLDRGLCVLCYSPDGPLSSNRKVHFLCKKTRKREQFIFFWYSRQARATVLLRGFSHYEVESPWHWVWSMVLPLNSTALHKEVPHFLALEASRSTLAHSKGVPNDTASIMHVEQKIFPPGWILMSLLDLVHSSQSRRVTFGTD